MNSIAPAAARPARKARNAISRSGRERETDDLVVVPDDHVAVGIGGVRPEDIRQLPPPDVGVCWLDQPGAADFREPLWRKSSGDELAAIVVDEVAVSVLDEERRPVHRVL